MFRRGVISYQVGVTVVTATLGTDLFPVYVRTSGSGKPSFEEEGRRGR